MLKLILVYFGMTVCAMAFHDNTFAVFELREQLLTLTLNLWELFGQLEYAAEPLRQRVYIDIDGVQADIVNVIAELIRLDQIQHPH